MTAKNKKHVKRRLIDILFWVAILVTGWTAYSGYNFMTVVKDVYTGQCAVIQERALDNAIALRVEEAVEAELQRRQAESAKEE